MAPRFAIDWDDDTFERVLERLRTEGGLDANLVRISPERLARILEAALSDPDAPHRRMLRDANFNGTIFEGGAAFTDVTFGGDADFSGASFDGDALYRRAAFEGDANFTDAAFSGDVDFTDASFSGEAFFGGASFVNADFGGACFSADASFHRASFKGDASFREAAFNGDATFFFATFCRADFDHAIFSGYGSFRDATFGGHSGFFDASFSGDVDFSAAAFGGNADFDAVTFERARQLGPVLVFEVFTLRDVVFVEPARIEVSARATWLDGSAFRAGADVLLRCGELSLEGAEFGQPSLVAELPATGGPVGELEFLDREEPLPSGAWVCRLDSPPAGLTRRVASVRRAKVARLNLSGLDLRACRFAGAYGLDALRVERARFAQPPTGRVRSGPMRSRSLWWTHRRTIAEEHHWRAEHGHGHEWYDGEVRAPDWLKQASEPPEPEEIAALYRSLRKGLEDNKDEPGAADFYYGEMEMRRHAAKARRRVRRIPGSEEAVLWLYWLVSGYGLRASRALIALALTVLVFAFFFDWWGFHPDRGFGRTLLFSIESTSSLFRVPQTEGFVLTAGGEALQVILRLLGPLFFGLALLSLRGRVKR